MKHRLLSIHSLMAGCLLLLTAVWSVSSPAQTAAGYVVLVQGKSTDDTGLNAHDVSTRRIYRILLERGFTADNIVYFNYDSGRPEVDAVPAADGIATAITEAADRMNQTPAPFYLIMTGHGTPDPAFLLDDGKITPADIDAWLRALEAQLSPTAATQPRTVVIGSNYSGGFIPELSAAGRMIISSAAGAEAAYKGPQEDIRSGEFFLDELFQALWRDQSWHAAFAAATANTEIFTRRDADTGNHPPPYIDNAVQHPLLDDNGDAQGNNVLISGLDGDRAAQLKLGITITPRLPAQIVEVTPPVYLEPNQSAASLSADVDPNGRAAEVWLEVRYLSDSLPLTQPALTGTLQLDNLLFRQDMTATQTGTGVVRYETVVDNFVQPGSYDIYYFVTDNLAATASPLRRSRVYKNIADNPPPEPFSLISPKDGETIALPWVFRWQDAQDDNEPVTYSLEISTDQTFERVIHRQDQLDATFAIVGPDTGLQTGVLYFWRVIACDRFGACRIGFAPSGEQQLYSSFIVASLNSAILRGTVYSSLSLFDVVPGATVQGSLPSEAYTMLSDGTGQYIFHFLTSGTVQVSAAKNGATASASTAINVGATSEVVLDLYLPLGPIFSNQFE